ncbi:MULTISPECIES: pilus assembly PilX family protein [Pseudoxanthomonas]|jgi:type IV pilus assembly protein PilX|uniref:Protein PilX n=1 Tax=Pseudoxanthomonas winnipegensis TaxID=2480810 RepID=A0A4Q8LIV3_9GAMM|nr:MULTISPECIES: PilX N-terminal domain-containing pilus assembly protein [Pseudoxanthomonas]MDQ1119583.1 type IV pilus assembly protein PilX [Pseudoxanthomonas winnipegensis]MDQ1132776.1 type IV pilus assembly protein PilX [Pseudoxanthomonas winnipegensis]MDR6137216.1 type IV pilus assembly protein PilX [Pseudoxanthomonas sp. SORGH_AS_0997]RZZ84451.1 protein PilX [Pseudoxanthomonas winnipegensis]TAA11022.1 protein PilX [Pseudoxanthomonas winnipegensis]
METERKLRAPRTPGRQAGAILYVALVMLLLLALLGLSGMTVASMQEKMASNYRQSDLAFQNAEAQARQKEAALKASALSVTKDSTACTFDALAWSRTQGAANAVYVRRLVCDATTGTSSNLGATLDASSVGSAYEITSLAVDTPSSPAATAVVQTIYIP